MNKSLITGTVLGAVIATAGGAAGYYKLIDQRQYADVISVKAVTKTINTPRQDCRDETVTHTRPVQDEHRIAGTAIGAVLGGVLGNQVGGGNGKKLATVAGAVAGGYAGNKTQQHMQQGDTYTTVEKRCNTVMDSHQEAAGYEVRYRLNDKVSTIHMDHDPGKKIPVKDGQLVLGTADGKNES